MFMKIHMIRKFYLIIKKPQLNYLCHLLMMLSDDNKKLRI